MKKLICHVSKEKNLSAVAKKILRLLGKFNLITLSGELGAGKTTLVQHLGKLLNIKKHINSPSFVLMKQYSIPAKKNRYLVLNHADFYRAKNVRSEFLSAAFDDPQALTIIEWPEKIKNLPATQLAIHIEVLKNKKRKIIIDPKGEIKKRARLKPTV